MMMWSCRKRIRGFVGGLCWVRGNWVKVENGGRWGDSYNLQDNLLTQGKDGCCRVGGVGFRMELPRHAGGGGGGALLRQ
jgi:hypothetical protein